LACYTLLWCVNVGGPKSSLHWESKANKR